MENLVLQDNNKQIEQNKPDQEIKHIISNLQQGQENINNPIQTQNYMIKLTKEASSQTDEIQEIAKLYQQIYQLKYENKVQQEQLDILKSQLQNQQEQFQNQIETKINELKMQLSQKIQYYFNAIDQKIINLDIAKILILDLVRPIYPINLILSNDKNNSLKFLQQIDKNAKINDKLNFISELKQNFSLTDDFNFEEIEERERQIAKLQDLFQYYQNKIGGIFIVTKFERNDIMKKSIMDIYKYFKKFSNLITIVVTHFHLSDSPQEDQEMLKKLFAIFQPKNIIFTGNKIDLQRNELAISLSKVNNQEFYPFDYRDTIFEPIDLNEQTKMMQAIQNQFNKKNSKNRY